MRNYENIIRSRAQDKLGRGEFAYRIADAIVSVPADRGYVLGIDGQWGAGKTSIVSMIVEAIRHREMQEITRLGGLPGDDIKEQWDLEKLHTLSTIYHSTSEIHDLIEGLDIAGRIKNLRFIEHFFEQRFEPPLAAELTRYTRLLAVVKKRPTVLPIDFSPWMIPESSPLSEVFLRDVVGRIGEVFPGPIGRAARVYQRALLDVMPLAKAGAAALGASGFFDLVESTIHWLLGREIVPIEAVKKALEVELRRISPCRILIVVDDIDRCTPAEAAEIVRLVKGLGNLPNVVYVLSYDHDILASQLNIALQVDGNEYLEKIVQLQKVVPVSPLSSLIDMMLTELGDVSDFAKNGRLGPEDIRLRMYILSHYIQTPRDVLRVAAAFNFSYAALKDVVDPSDLFVLEMINALDRPLYNWIKKYIANLAYGRRTASDAAQHIGGRQDVIWQLRKDKLVGGWSDARLNVVAFLFPGHTKDIGATQFANEDTRRTHLVRDYQHSLTFFSLYSESVSWSRDDLARVRFGGVIGTFSRMHVAVGAKDRPTRSELRAQFLAYTRQWVEENPLDCRMWVEEVVGASKRLVELQDAEGNTENLDRLERVLEQALRLVDERERGDVVRERIETADDISVLCGVIRSGRLNPLTDDIFRAIAERFRRLVNTGDLWSQCAPHEIIYAASKNVSDIREILTPKLKNRRAARILLRMWTRSSGTRYSIDSSLDGIFDLSVAAKRAEQFKKSGNNDDRAIGEFFLTGRANAADPDDDAPP